MLLVANLANTKWRKNLKNDRNHGKWVLIWENSVRAIYWIPTWQGLDGFQRSSRPCALDESNLSIERVKLFSKVSEVHMSFLKEISRHECVNIPDQEKDMVSR